MSEPGKPAYQRVQCANCKLQIDANKYLVVPPEGWPAESLHQVACAEGGFVGSVHCPNCDHFTSYAPETT